VLDPEQYKVFEGVRRGAYKLLEGDGQLLLVATGAGVHVILAAARELCKENIHPTVISMPSFKLFEEQEDSYKAAVFPGKSWRFPWRRGPRSAGTSTLDAKAWQLGWIVLGLPRRVRSS
jgi:transketolase